MYKSPQAVVKVNGALSEPFGIYRGVRQGDCLSPLIFVLCMEPFAESIRKNKNITGITVGGGEYKVALYADDIMVTMINCGKSLDNLMEEIKQYSKFSGYKLNVNKTEAMTMGDLDIEIKNKFNFKWDCEYLKYLGVYIPKTIVKVFQINYNNLLHQIKSDFNRWKLLHLSIIQKIQSIKMIMLPRFLFLFQNLPCYIPPKYFKEWDYQIRKFIWDEKKPRVKLKNLKLPKSDGGLALPDLKKYFEAAQIKKVMNWISDISAPKWVEMESSKLHLIKSAIYRYQDKELKKEMKSNYCINNTFKVWKNVINKLKIDINETIYIREISKDPDFKANKTEKIFNIWADKGLVRFYQLFKNNELETYENLSKQYDLSKKQFYTYLQIRSYALRKLPKKAKDLHPLMTYMANNCNKRKPKNVITHLYKILSSQEEKLTNNIRTKWEEELLIKITEEEWIIICSGIHKIIGSLFWREFSWKIIIQFFLTPNNMRKYIGNSNCWRNCGENNADYLHMFYSCKTIQTFWREINTILESVFKKKLQIKAENALLGKLPTEITSEERFLFQIFRVAALKTITNQWKKATHQKLKIG